MDKDRLLTLEEWDVACAAMDGGSKCSDCRIALCQAQDAKTLAATLRAVGEWLNRHQHFGDKAASYVEVVHTELAALLTGKTPEGWKSD